jgi:hypothetical protein
MRDRQHIGVHAPWSLIQGMNDKGEPLAEVD